MMGLWKLIPGLVVALVLAAGAPRSAIAQSINQAEMDAFVGWVMTLKPVNEQCYEIITPMNEAETTFYDYTEGHITEEEARAAFVDLGLQARAAAQETLDLWQALPGAPKLRSISTARMEEAVAEIPELVASVEVLALSSIDAFATMALDPDADLENIPVLVFRRTEAVVEFMERSLRNDLASLTFGHPQGVVLESLIYSNSLFVEIDRYDLAGLLGLSAEEKAAVAVRIDTLLAEYEALVETGPGLQAGIIRQIMAERERAPSADRPMYSRVLVALDMYDTAWEIERNAIRAYRNIIKAQRSTISEEEYSLTHDRIMAQIELYDVMREDEIFARVEQMQGK